MADNRGEIWDDHDAKAQWNRMAKADYKGQGFFKRGEATGDWSHYEKWQTEKVMPLFKEYQRLLGETEELKKELGL